MVSSEDAEPSNIFLTKEAFGSPLPQMMVFRLQASFFPTSSLTRLEVPPSRKSEGERERGTERRREGTVLEVGVERAASLHCFECDGVTRG
ncbi:hypothetical protein AOLI_G00307320 [Acnodon oligacanthus]